MLSLKDSMQTTFLFSLMLLSITHIDNVKAENLPDEVLVDDDLLVADLYVISLFNIDLLIFVERDLDDLENVDEKSASKMHVDHVGANH